MRNDYFKTKEVDTVVCNMIRDYMKEMINFLEIYNNINYNNVSDLKKYLERKIALDKFGDILEKYYSVNTHTIYKDVSYFITQIILLRKNVEGGVKDDSNEK